MCGVGGRQERERAAGAADTSDSIINVHESPKMILRLDILPLVAAFQLLVLLLFVSHVTCESFSPDNERLGIAYEFKINLDPGKEDCFYQYIRAHSSLYVAFQV